MHRLTHFRLYQRAIFMGFRRGQRAQHENQALVKIQGLKDRNDVPYYLGKRVAYVYRGKNEKDGKKLRTIWGKVVGHHGNNGTVRAKFQHNLPGSAIGGQLRVMLFPQHD